MDKKSPSDPSPTHGNDRPDRPDVPVPGYPELIMMKIGVLKHPYLYAFLHGIGILACLLLYEYVCRRYCDMDADTCRSRRKDIMFWIEGFFTVLGIRAKYREALIHEKVAAWQKYREERIKQAGETSIPAS